MASFMRPSTVPRWRFRWWIRLDDLFLSTVLLYVLAEHGAVLAR